MLLFSICIPTYNRAATLDKTIASIVTDPFFSERDCVDIVISDNCSTDNTKEICEKYIALFPNKIKYFRQNENIEDRNFIEVLKLAEGKFAKLNNDNLMVNLGTLEYICQKISNNEFKETVFFSNGVNDSKNEIDIYNNIDEFLGQVSYFCTWIGGFCIKKEAFTHISVPERFSGLKLAQVDILCRMIERHKGITVVGKVLFCNIEIHKKAGFRMEKIFGDNYLTILEQFVINGSLSRIAYNKAKKDILANHILPTKFSNINKNYEYNHKTYFFKDLHKYWGNIYFYKYVLENIVKKELSRKWEKRAPRWFINFICCFVPKKKNRDSIREKYSRI